MTTIRIDPARFASAVVETVETMRWERRFRSVRALVLASGMTHTYLNARLSGTTLFTVADLAALGNAFDTGPDEIVDRAILAAVSVADDTLEAVASTETMVEGAGEFE